MGAEKLRAQVLGDTANCRSIKNEENEENKASIETTCETENMIHFIWMYILHACTYFPCIYTKRACIYVYVYILNVFVHVRSDKHTQTHWKRRL